MTTPTTPLFGDPLPIQAVHQVDMKPIRKPIWTEQKAKLIAAYLRLFVFITKHGAYVDGFAGPQNAEDPEVWSARLVLANEPAWMKQFVLCDLKADQVARLEELRLSQPVVKGRRVVVLPGDFNATWREALAAARIKDSTATFCVLDQRTFECDWATVEGIARYKSGDANKIELFYFLPIAWFDRAISGLKNKTEVDRWWGRADWQTFQNASTQERAHIFARRLERELGYRFVIPWAIREKSQSRRVMYFMVHASDHPEAPTLMRRAYTLATAAPEQAEQLEMAMIAGMKRERDGSAAPVQAAIASPTPSKSRVSRTKRAAPPETGR